MPCAATRVGDSAYLMDQPELMAPAQDHQALASVICKTLDLEPDPKERLGRDLRQRIVENFSVEHLLEHTQKLLMDLAASRF